MEPEDFQWLRQLFDRLIDLPASERKRELDRLPPEHGHLRVEVEALLAAAEAAETRSPGVIPTVTGDPTYVSRRPKVSPGMVLAGRYHLKRLLGAGGFAQAFLAEDELLHAKQVVIKLPLRESHENAEWHARHFADEIRALAALNHPGIVDVIDSAVDPVHGEFFIEQFVDGPTLAQLLEKGPPGIERSAALLEKIALAVAAAHAKGVIHRDLKPQNIIVRAPGTAEEAPVIIDFGIASLLGPDDRSLTTRAAGTPAYLAPEQALGRVLPQSDLYALGCIAVELLTGERLNSRRASSSSEPIVELRAMSLLETKAPEVAPAARPSITRLLKLNPAERGTSLEQAAFFRQLAPRRIHSGSSSRRAWLVAGGLGATAAGVAFFASSGETKKPDSRAEVLRLSVKAFRNNASGTTAMSPRDGVVTQKDKIRFEVEASPQAYCYVFAESLAAPSGPANDLSLLYPPQPRQRPFDRFTVPSTTDDWIKFDEKPEILRLLLIASLAPVPEADQAVRAGQSDGVVHDAQVREALDGWVRRSPAAGWAEASDGVWVAASEAPVLCVEGRLQHITG